MLQQKWGTTQIFFSWIRFFFFLCQNEHLCLSGDELFFYENSGCAPEESGCRVKLQEFSWAKQVSHLNLGQDGFPVTHALHQWQIPAKSCSFRGAHGGFTARCRLSSSPFHILCKLAMGSEISVQRNWSICQAHLGLPVVTEKYFPEYAETQDHFCSCWVLNTVCWP